MAETRVVLDPGALARLLRGPTGPVVRYEIKIAEAVQREAKQLVGYSEDAEPGHKHLRDTIVKRITSTASGVVVEVGTSEPHAVFHHEGTRPHEIRPRFKKALRFKVGGEFVFATKVNHPGTQPNRFLVDALERVMRRMA